MRAFVQRGGRRALLLLGVSGLFALQAFGDVAGQAQPVGKTVKIDFKSTHPRYGKIAVNEDGSKVLNVAFDESRGTGKGFDTLYVLECDNNGAVQKYQSYTAMRSTEGDTAIYEFKPVVDKTVFKSGLVPGMTPFSAVFEYHRTEVVNAPAKPTRAKKTASSTTTVAAVSAPVAPVPHLQTTEEFMFCASFSLIDADRHEWGYSLNGKMPLADSLDAAQAVKLGEGTPTMSVNSERIDRSESEVGLGVDFQLGDFTLDCTLDSRGIPVALEIKNSDGKSLVRDKVRQDDLAYSVKSRTRRVITGYDAPGGGHGGRGGRGGRGGGSSGGGVTTKAVTTQSIKGYSVRVPSGTYTVEINADFGPYKGVTKLSEKVELK